MMGYQSKHERKSRVLTPRETQILPFLIDGEVDKTIALRLGISNRTVEYHVSSIIAKFGLRNRTQAAVAADRLARVMPGEMVAE